MKVVIAYELEIVSNKRKGRGGFAASTRAALQRRMGCLAVAASEEPAPPLPVVVTLTRVGPGWPDWSNTVGAFKHIQDGVADALGLSNDEDPRITWKYERRREKKFAIEIAIEARP